MNTKSRLLQLRENEREVRKNLIINAAVKLFAQKPFNQVSMRHIAAEADISPASIYRYFSDRDELFVEAFFRESKDISENLFKLLQDNLNATIEDVAVVFVDYLLDHDNFFQMMAHFMLDGDINQKALERFNAAERRLLDVFERTFEKMGARDNVRLYAHAFFACLNGVLITFRKYPGRSDQEVRKHMHRLALLIAGVFKEALR